MNNNSNLNNTSLSSVINFSAVSMLSFNVFICSSATVFFEKVPGPELIKKSASSKLFIPSTSDWKKTIEEI